MSEKEIKDKVISLLLLTFSENENAIPDVIEYLDLIDDLGMNSLSFVMLVIELEKYFGIELPDDKMLPEYLRNCTMICSEIQALLDEKEAENKEDAQ